MEWWGGLWKCSLDKPVHEFSWGSLNAPPPPGRMFLNSRLARVITHVLARVTTHVLARALLHVLAHSSRQLELARVATHVLARVATHVLARVVTHVLARVTMHMLGHVSIPITYLHGYQGHWCGQTRCRP